MEKEEQKTEEKKPEKAVETVAEKPKEEEKSQKNRFYKKSDKEKIEEVIESWDPKTKLGREVKDGKIKNIDEILERGRKILEGEITDSLINLKTDLISIGQSKGKFGGGKRRAWRQTQRKTKEGNVPKFSTLAVVGDEDGHVGVGSGKAKETLPARDKAIRKAKLNIMKINRACAGFDCACSELHTVPFEITGKSGSVRIKLIPAPQGTGLVVTDELKKILKMAGIKDVYSRTTGKKRTTFNLIKACIDALKKTNKVVKK
ncbi:MAG TPA: 30S ribosomal protein S5 [Candidatus Pacearchaeota archaeon]|nr:30S ribosomal protein S5 [archaeon BMS3Abin17]HDK42259.1 30S ribosomal protein S5 [Candidatus Pacearchaeota archaeon]HDZ60403.1 30S ribosomal protein S5 [Candidatus Pacearchaeota archaeon]